MSGICGVIQFDEKYIKKDKIQKMLDSMKNRGQDAEGIHVNGNIGLGHKMLWTTPESLHENQPHINNESSLILTADARLDNRNELFKKLEISKDEIVVTDVDLILKAYQKWGNNCSKHLLGDFSFAIYDTQLKELYCARSVIGIKPFYYFLNKEVFIFASEISSIKAIVDSVIEVDITSIKHLMDEYVVPCNDTCYKNIKRLSPAQFMILKNKKIDFTRFWFPEKININKRILFDEAQDQFITLLKEAIQCRMRSAYPIGCELSGGLDSSTVLSLAIEMLNTKNIYPISSYYGEMECDESEYIKAVSNNLQIDPLINNAHKLDYKNEFSLEAYYSMSMDWPGSGSFMDSVGEYKIAQEKNIRVLLTGQGGDHVAAGNLYMLADYLKTLDLKKLYNELKIQRYPWRVFRNYALIPILPISVKRMIKFFRKKMQKKLSQIDLCHDTHGLVSKSFAQKFDLGTITGLACSTWVDSSPSIYAGRFNVELRHPFFDQRLIEFMLSLPPSFKLQEGITKRILRESMKNRLPEVLYNRKDKAEFSSIVAHQIKCAPTEDYELKLLQEFDMLSKQMYDNIKNTTSYKDIYSLANLADYVYIEKWLKYINKEKE